MMNQGARLDDIVHSVRAPEHLLARPYLRPVYDEPEFVVRNIWRYYGGWYDGDPSHLKPAPAAELAQELAALAGGANKLAERAAELAAGGDLRLASHLAELAAQAAPDDKALHAVRAEVFGTRAKAEASTMSKGIFSWAEHESRGAEQVKLEHANILVTGASSGIGAALAPILAERGATVGIVARRADRLREVLDRCRRHSPDSRMWSADLGDLDRAEQVALEAWDAFGGLDALVNNAAIPKRTHVTDLTPADVDARHGRRLPLPRPHEPRGAPPHGRARLRHDRLRVEHGRTHPDRQRGRVQRGQVRDVRMGGSDVPRPRGYGCDDEARVARPDRDRDLGPTRQRGRAHRCREGAGRRLRGGDRRRARARRLRVLRAARVPRRHRRQAARGRQARALRRLPPRHGRLHQGPARPQDAQPGSGRRVRARRGCR